MCAYCCCLSCKDAPLICANSIHNALKISWMRKAMSEIPLLFLRHSRYPEGPLIDPFLNSCLSAPDGHRIAGAHHVNDVRSSRRRRIASCERLTFFGSNLRVGNQKVCQSAFLSDGPSAGCVLLDCGGGLAAVVIMKRKARATVDESPQPRAAHQRLVAVARESAVSQRALEKLVVAFREGGVPEAASRATQYRARKEMCSTVTPYGSVCQDVSLPASDPTKSDVRFHLQNPLAFLQKMRLATLSTSPRSCAPTSRPAIPLVTRGA